MFYIDLLDLLVNRFPLHVAWQQERQANPCWQCLVVVEEPARCDGVSERWASKESHHNLLLHVKISYRKPSKVQKLQSPVDSFRLLHSTEQAHSFQLQRTQMDEQAL